jgi:hypothetical protein
VITRQIQILQKKSQGSTIELLEQIQLLLELLEVTITFLDIDRMLNATQKNLNINKWKIRDEDSMVRDPRFAMLRC